MGMNEEISKRLNDDLWDKQISNQVSAVIKKKNFQTKISYSIVLLLLSPFSIFGVYYEGNSSLSDEYYNLYSYFIGEEIALFEFVD